MFLVCVAFWLNTINCTFFFCFDENIDGNSLNMMYIVDKAPTRRVGLRSLQMLSKICSWIVCG